MDVMMSAREQELFKAFLSRSKGYFEFGIGGSTVLAGRMVDGPVVAVDSDPAWIETASTTLRASAHPRRLVHVDIGPVGTFGMPASEAHRDRFPLYSAAIRGIAEPIDLCLVDGRFRVACALQALLALPPDGVLGLHDYRNRPQYHVIEHFARPVAEAETLTFFLPRPETERRSLSAILKGRPSRMRRRIEALLKTYAFNPA